MSLENDISQLKEADVFKPASKKEVTKRQKDRPWKRFYFPITLSGAGFTIDEAWEEATQYFSEDPGNWADGTGPVRAVREDPETQEEIGPEEIIS